MIHTQIAGLIQQARDHHLIERADEIYARNQILGLLKLVSYPERMTERADDTIPNLLDNIIAYAIDAEVITDVFDEKEILRSEEHTSELQSRGHIVYHLLHAKKKC